jgi:cyclophilin family peptidyl-prolyl cis-trans isomerase
MSRILIAVGAVLVLLGAGYWFIFMQGGAQTSTFLYDPFASGDPPAETATTTSTTEPTTNQSQTIMKATLHTTKGDITIELFPSEAPKTVENFTKLAKAGFYDGTKFHRVIPGFMIQGGDPLSKDDSLSARWGTGGPGYQFADELRAANHNDIGTISMANSGPNTNGSQFFINTAANNFLDPKHTTFGKVVGGMEVVKAIEATPTGAGDRPLSPMVITSITLQ